MNLLSTLLSLSPELLLHTGTQGGALAGFLHPLLGLDHLLAMVAVGLLSAQIGGRAIWTVPAFFVAAMLLGGILGIAGVDLPIVEYGITGSVLALGIAIILQESSNNDVLQCIAVIAIT